MKQPELLYTKIKFVVYILIVVLFLISGFNIQKKNTGGISIKKIIREQLKIYPSMQIEDVYKLLYQSALGSEHAVKDTSAARKWMENEIANLSFARSDSLVENISPDGRIVRVNLRPYLKKNYDPKVLLATFIKTAEEFKGSKDTLENYLDATVEMAEKGELKLNVNEMKKYFEKMKRDNYPAVHHSKKYASLYSPAYRVVDIKYIPFLKDDHH